MSEGREKSLAITRLEEIMFWASAALARPQLGVSIDPDKLIDPDCRDGKHGSCVIGFCECECHKP